MKPESTQLQEVHAHEVINMMTSSGNFYSRTSLLAAIADQFGPNARFHTCSATGMTADELIDFLAARGKFSGTAENFSFNPARACGH